MQKAKPNNFIIYLRKFVLSKLSNNLCLNNTVNNVFDQKVTGSLNKNSLSNLCIHFMTLIPYLRKEHKSTSFFCIEKSLKNLMKVQKLNNIKFFICYRKIQPVEDENEDDHQLKSSCVRSFMLSMYCI